MKITRGAYSAVLTSFNVWRERERGREVRQHVAEGNSHSETTGDSEDMTQKYVYVYAQQDTEVKLIV